VPNPQKATVYPHPEFAKIGDNFATHQNAIKAPSLFVFIRKMFACLSITHMLRDLPVGSGSSGQNSENSVEIKENQTDFAGSSTFSFLAGLGLG
jgi:hypothetical protein